MCGGRQVALFFTGPKHAGERLADLLRERASSTGPPIQMCDALSRNLPSGVETVLGHCLAHGRRKFVEIHSRFPEPCLHVLEQIGVVYHTDQEAREQGLDPELRLRLHQERSKPVMEALHTWMQRELDEKRVEPNGGLGKAFAYLQNHWQELTLFLRVAGAPIDNNLAERSLKMAILHRRNSLFYRTQHGAEVGDLLMTLIHTCRLCGANPFDYLNALQVHRDRVVARPADWMPWSYREHLASHESAG